MLEKRPRDTKYRLTKENNQALLMITEELKLDNPNQTINVIVKNYAIFKRVERLFMSFTGFLEAFQELTVKNMGTMLSEAGITNPKHAQKIKDSLKNRDKKSRESRDSAPKEDKYGD